MGRLSLVLSGNDRYLVILLGSAQEEVGFYEVAHF